MDLAISEYFSILGHHGARLHKLCSCEIRKTIGNNGTSGKNYARDYAANFVDVDAEKKRKNAPQIGGKYQSRQSCHNGHIVGVPNQCRDHGVPAPATKFRCSHLGAEQLPELQFSCTLADKVCGKQKFIVSASSKK